MICCVSKITGILINALDASCQVRLNFFKPVLPYQVIDLRVARIIRVRLHHHLKALLLRQLCIMCLHLELLFDLFPLRWVGLGTYFLNFDTHLLVTVCDRLNRWLLFTEEVDDTSKSLFLRFCLFLFFLLGLVKLSLLHTVQRIHHL